MSFFRHFVRSCSKFAPVAIPTFTYRPVTPTKPSQPTQEIELLNEDNGAFIYQSNHSNISNQFSFDSMQICSWNFQPNLYSPSTNSAPKSKRGKENIINSNKKRTGVKKNKYSNKFKLELCDYRREHGANANDIIISPTYKCYAISSSTMYAILKDEDVWRREVENGNGHICKNHKGAKIKYPMVEEPLKLEYNIRKKKHLDVSRGWAQTRASNMYLEWQVYGSIETIEWKPPTHWTPFEINAIRQKEAKLKRDIDEANNNGNIELFPQSQSWFYAWKGRNVLVMKNIYAKKDMSYEEWKKIQFDVFLPIEISFLRSLNNNAIYDYYGRLVKCNIWNDDEVPLVLFSKCKQLCEKQMKGVSDGVIKSLVTTRSLKHRFLTFAPFLNGDGYTLLPDEYAICLVIFPGIIDNNDIQYFKNKCPNLRVFSNKKSWMTQENKKKNKSKKRKQQSNTINNYFKKQRLE